MKVALKERRKESEAERLKRKVRVLEATIAHLEKNLIHDPLTGLKTRAFFEQEARVYIDIVERGAAGKGSRRKQWFAFKNVSLIFFDIDHFKKVNDKLGHGVGDTVLKAVADTIKLSLREGDTAARWGGEEIVVTLVGATERNAFDKAEDIRRQVENIKFSKLPKLSVTISAGVATVESGQNFESIMKRVDGALYKAKQTGRNKIVKYSELA
jgi:diguanylate cyclase (GGDEF)-like protein